jgi:DNA-binding MarR family transcriptional regulator
MANRKSVDVDGCVLEASLGNLARAAHRAFVKELERHTLPYAISAAQWPLLRALWHEEGLTQRELSRRVAVREPTMTNALSKMEKAGFIRRLAPRDDHRSRRVFLSVKGKRLRKTLMPCVESINEIAIADIGPDDVATARYVLIAMNRNLAEASNAGTKLSDHATHHAAGDFRNGPERMLR